MKRKSERQRLVERVDDLVSRKVRMRDGYRCQKCGKIELLGAAHVLAKGNGRYARLRFEEYNLMTLCWFPCHDWWHKNPHDARAWFDAKWPGRYEKLQEMAACAPKVDLKLLLTVLQAEASNG